MKNDRVHLDINGKHLRHASGHSKCNASMRASLLLTLHPILSPVAMTSGNCIETMDYSKQQRLFQTHARDRMTKESHERTAESGPQMAPDWRTIRILPSSRVRSHSPDALVHWNIYNRPTVRDNARQRHVYRRVLCASSWTSFLDCEIIRYGVVNPIGLIVVSSPFIRHTRLCY